MLVSPGIILNKTGSFQSTIKFQGPDLYSSTNEELNAVSVQVNNALKRPGSGWSFFVEAQRREVNHYPVCIWPNKASELIDKEREALFKSSDKQFESTYYITFSYMPPSERVKNLSNRFLSDTTEKINYQVYVEHFQKEMAKITDILSRIFIFAENLNDDQTLSYLHSCISTKNHDVKCPEVPIFLDYILTDQIFQGGLNPKLGDSHLKIISISGFPQESYP
ncbi:hypothetical protein GMMP15_1780005 [Candidatus Magnetomoraceae bacterium gMMP-15]